MEIDPPSKKRKRGSFTATEIKQNFFLRKKTRRLIQKRIMRILFNEKIYSIEWTVGTTSDDLDEKIRKTCGLLPRDSQAYDLYNESGHSVPFDNERFPEDFNLELRTLNIPRQGYTLEETVTWKNLVNKIAQSVGCFSSPLCELVAEYAHPSIYFVGNKVDMQCVFDQLWWISTIIQKTDTYVVAKIDGWKVEGCYQKHYITNFNNLSINERERYSNEDKLNPLKQTLEPLGTHTGSVGEIVKRRFLLPWKCDNCQTWNASHHIKCCNQICLALRPFYDFNWCHYGTEESRKTCEGCQWICKCGLVCEPYWCHCENCAFSCRPMKLNLKNCFSVLASDLFHYTRVR